MDEEKQKLEDEIKQLEIKIEQLEKENVKLVERIHFLCEVHKNT